MISASTKQTSQLQVTVAITKRGLMRMRRLPSLMIPSIIMPIFFVVAFSGSFSSVVQLDGYSTDKAVNWMAAWAILQGSAFSGLGGGGLTATDLENGFFDRMRAAPITPSALISGLVGYSVTRAVLPTTAVLIVSFVALDADMPGGLLGFVIAYFTAIGIAAVMSLFVLGIVFTMKTLKSLAVAQVVMFSTMFLSVGQAPLEAIQGWLYHVAKYNPITHVIRMGRQGFLGDVTWAETQPGFISLALLLIGSGLWARSCYQKVDI